MPLNQIRFDKGGGPITVEITFGYAQVGAYTLVLWDATGTGKRKLGEGVNTDLIPDVYVLPQPNVENDGRLLDSVATVIAPNPQPGERYRVDMIVRQNDIECGREFDEGPIDRKSVSTRLAVQLVAN
jgi:hypothetical protein